MSLWLYTTVYIVFIVHHHNQHLYTCIHCVCYYHLHLCHNHCVPCLYTAVSIYLFYCFYPSIHYCRCTIVYILLDASLCLYTSLFHNFVHSSCRVQQNYYHTIYTPLDTYSTDLFIPQHSSSYTFYLLYIFHTVYFTYAQCLSKQTSFRTGVGITLAHHMTICTTRSWTIQA